MTLTKIRIYFFSFQLQDDYQYRLVCSALVSIQCRKKKTLNINPKEGFHRIIYRYILCILCFTPQKIKKNKWLVLHKFSYLYLNSMCIYSYYLFPIAKLLHNGWFVINIYVLFCNIFESR